MRTLAGVQAGAVPYRVDDRGVLHVCLITNSQGGWIVPKGKIDAGHTARQAARTECFEEAGLRGVLHRPVLGRYAYRKPGEPGPALRVRLYALRVERELASWPEQAWRRRRWMTLAEARRQVAFRDLARVLVRVARLASRG
jgi:ADP-ribose pyrophosphatase YjhB (NUDIX family)